MSDLNPLDPSSFAELEAMIARIAPQWMANPNIVAIVPALKTKGGYVQPQKLVLGFYVREKVAPALLQDRGYSLIPSEIEGISTDVIPAVRKPLGSVDTKETRSQMFDTLAGGMAVGNANMNAYGTLAMILFAQDDGRPVGLTNEHVLVFDGDGHMGDEVQQPRFYLNSEVSIDSATCCPNGQLHYRPVDNPIVDAAAGVFAAAAVAAALSDQIDPHRRGQDATVPDLTARTLRETVSVEMQYPEIPLPGYPYNLDVKWKYQRVTDRRTLEYSASETKPNLHVVQTQELLTDRPVYQRGNQVVFFALLGAELNRETCQNYFVTAAAMSPSHRRAYKIILKPWEIDNAPRIDNPNHSLVGGQAVRRCISFNDQKSGDCFRHPRSISGIIFDPEDHTACFVQRGATEPPALVFPPAGLTIRFSTPVQEVFGSVVFNASVTMTAFNGASEVGTATTSGTSPASLHLTAPGITHVVFHGNDESPKLLEMCTVKHLQKYCAYRGEFTLLPDEEIGMWSTYLFAQTRNDVPLGADPLIAATTIGGLPVTSNFVDAGGSDNITYGHSCLVDIVPNGQFEVTPAVVIG
ncbi:hypothetical protein SAMN05216428_102259 [Nitrosospira sp. Nsp11]|uniref:hypothetical protein n=1 Tax=Nitrosospira sp. Nsp11 TaxID=1855338 RepID=UPI000922FC0D|nr:hypothetical protein [Nitrosospira sp. Nsp11]SHL39546.1 hypothetical protein SAMN05216428_102259 [Nitrosospira sp. Nsp11]